MFKIKSVAIMIAIIVKAVSIQPSFLNEKSDFSFIEWLFIIVLYSTCFFSLSSPARLELKSVNLLRSSLNWFWTCESWFVFCSKSAVSCEIWFWVVLKSTAFLFIAFMSCCSFKSNSLNSVSVLLREAVWTWILLL